MKNRYTVIHTLCLMKDNIEMFSAGMDRARKYRAGKRLSTLCAMAYLSEEEESEAIRIIRTHLHCPDIINIVTRKNINPPIMNALLNQHNDIINTLIYAHETDFNQTGKNKENLLHFLIARLDMPGYREFAMRVLMKPNIQYNAKDANGSTALILAARHHLEMLEPLLQMPDIDVNAITLNLKTGASDNALTALIENCHKHREDEMTQNIFILKAERLLRTMLSVKNVQVDQRLPKVGNEGDGYLQDATALMLGAKYGLNSLVKILLNYSANSQFVDSLGRNAAKIAEENGHENVAALIRGFHHDSALQANTFIGLSVNKNSELIDQASQAVKLI